MPLLDPYHPLAAFREALSSILWALFFSVIVCMFGAAIPTLAIALWSHDSWDASTFVAALVSAPLYWIMSGVQLWGIILIALQTVFLNCLVQKSGDPLLYLCAIFMNQVFVSTTELAIVMDQPDRTHVLAAGIITLGISFCFLVLLYRAGKKSQTS